MERRRFERGVWRRLPGPLAAACLIVALLGGSPAKGEEPRFSPGLFGASLHHTGEGMRHWYSEAGGFKDVTGIPYEDVKCQECKGEDHFACTSCHIDSCDRCHAKGEAGRGEAAYTLAGAKKGELCLGCHQREALAARLDAEAKTKTPLAHQGMACTDCHGGSDVHGDGIRYESLNSPGAMKASCGFCHGTVGSSQDDVRAHKIHASRLDCAACHVTSSMTCYNCHFEAAMKTGEKKGNFIPMKSWLLLVNREGKVTAGGVQSLTWKGKNFIAYAPQFTHSVVAQGRGCPECHASEAVKLLAKGQKVPVVAYKEGQVVPWKGVVPAAAGKLEWVFLQKQEGGGWAPQPGPVKEQWTGYATPLREDQIKRMAKPMKE